MARLGIATALAICLGAPAAEAFPGFYVAGSDAAKVNDATHVVLMRKGTRTVVTMRNHYQGPPEAFALVVPVPSALKDSDVKTLSPDVFATLERIGAPRLVEYQELDPCAPMPRGADDASAATSVAGDAQRPVGAAPDVGVTVEAQFTVAEYQIAIVAANHSAGLDAWLRREKYQLPAGAESLLPPYIERGMKFLVAKVDPKKVAFEPAGDGLLARAALSPLRFHYDSERFELPIRLGLVNSAGTQDLIVYILAPGQRYEAASYPNVTIPTNITVSEDVRDQFDAFYAALFDETLERVPNAVVTEYAWDASTCDPCTAPPLRPSHLNVLGGDVIEVDRSFVLTRLHARYGKDIQHDLVFRQAEPITGGRERMAATGKLEQAARRSATSMFQARYAIRHAWEGPITCTEPVRGRWQLSTSIRPALDLASAPRGTLELADVVRDDIPELGIDAGTPTIPPANAPATAPTMAKVGCGCRTGETSGSLVVVALALLCLTRRR